MNHTLEGRYQLRGHLGLCLAIAMVVGILALTIAPWRWVRFSAFAVVMVSGTFLNAERLPIWEEKKGTTCEEN